MCPIILSGKCRQLPSDLHQIVMMKALESSLVMLVTKKVIVFFFTSSASEAINLKSFRAIQSVRA